MASRYLSAVQNHRNLIAFLNIWCAGHDLNGLRADIHLADDQFIRIRMAFDPVDPADYDLLQVFVEAFKAFYFRSA